jgi:hypothetical protein
MRSWRVETSCEMRLFRTVTGGKVVRLRFRFCGLDGEVADDRHFHAGGEMRLFRRGSTIPLLRPGWRNRR